MHAKITWFTVFTLLTNTLNTTSTTITICFPSTTALNFYVLMCRKETTHSHS